ncbi:hypothetical protein JCM6882_000050 [Rhodosporidiobolus microsporus]
MINVTKTAEGNLLTYVDGEEVIYNLGDMAWVITATAIVLMFIPGLALLYSGLLRRKNALSMIFLAFAVYAMGSIHWMLMGYSLTYSDSGGPFIGTLKHGGYVGVDINPSPVPTIPALLYAIYQSQFEAITLVVIVAGGAERAHVLPTMIWLFCWATVIYCPLAYWTWNANGWLYVMGELDFAGGGPVHIASGVASFVYAWFVGPRRGYGTPKLDYRPQSSTLICLGTGFIWFGWCCFNGASMSGMSLKSVICVVNTVISGSAGALVWVMIDWIYTRKYSAVGVCSGILAGLIGITPAVGYVSPPGALAVGAGAAIASNFATGIKRLVKVDDPVDAFALHGCGGIAGGILTGFFAEARIAAYDESVIVGGWIDHNWIQLGYQLAGICSVVAWTAVVSYILLFLINLIPGLKFRVSEDYEIVGIDEAEIGEYAHDYLHLARDILDDDESRRSASRGRTTAPKPAQLQLQQQAEKDSSPASSKAAAEGSASIEPVRSS